MGVGEAILLVLIVLVVLVALGLLVGTWLTVRIVGSIVRGAGRLLRSAVTPSRRLPGNGTTRCPRPKCHAANHSTARFCRRCGVAMQPHLLPASPAQRDRRIVAIHS
jgi:hypothetical protein